MNKMYAYLKEHAYVSENKHSNYQFELSEERAKCIANKYNSLTEELQQENTQLRIQISAREEEYKKLEDNWNELKIWLKKELGDRINPNKDKWLTGVYDAYRETIDKMQELERGVSDD